MKGWRKSIKKTKSIKREEKAIIKLYHRREPLPSREEMARTFISGSLNKIL
jgi:hypothetical protein